MTDVVLFNPVRVYSANPPTPLSLMALSTCLKQNGYEVKIVDGGIEKNAEKEVLSSLDDAICFGITCMTGPPIHIGLSMAKKVREKIPELPIVWGGFHPSLLPEQTIQHPLVDIVVRGQGEETMVELVDALKNRQPLKNVKGLTYKQDGKIISNLPRPLRDINDFPMPDYSSIDIKGYAKHGPVYYLTSRGCPYRCAFCTINHLYGRRWFRYPAERVIQELKFIVETYGVKDFRFGDDNFFVDTQRVKQICDGIEELDITWESFGRCDIFSRLSNDVLKKIKSSGCTWISFGAESGSQKILDMIHKDITIKEIIETVKKCKEFNIDADFTFMTGFPGESINDLKMTMKLFDKMYSINKNISIRLFSFTPSPKIELIDACVKNGLTLPTSFEEWGKFGYEEHINPWLSAEHKSLIKTFDFLITFLFAVNKKRFEKKWQNIIYKILRKDARIRWRHRFFRFPLEWLLVRKYASKFYSR